MRVIRVALVLCVAAVVVPGSVESMTPNSPPGAVEDYRTQVDRAFREPSGFTVEGFTMALNNVHAIYANHMSAAVLPSGSLDDNELAMVFEAAHQIAQYAFAYRPGLHDGYVVDLAGRFAEMERRNLVDAPRCTVMLEHLMNGMRLDEARQVLARCPMLDPIWIPEVKTMQPFDQAAPAVMMLDGESNQLRLSNVELREPFQVVVVGNCHFAREAAAAIHADPEVLAALQAAGIIWLADDGLFSGPGFFRDWNDEFPGLPLAVPYRRSAWPDTDFWGGPIFHFFSGETLLHKFSGWHEGAISPFRAELDRHDALTLPVAPSGK